MKNGFDLLKNLIVVTFNDGNDFVDHKNLYEKNFNLIYTFVFYFANKYFV